MAVLDAIVRILLESWHILNEAAIYILFGLCAAGFIYVFVPQSKIIRYLGAEKLKSVLYASALGIPVPLCSCGVVPTAMSIRQQGASRGATSAFLISTPETGVDSIAITYALIDPLMTIYRPIAAFFTATFAGVLENLTSSGSSDEVPDFSNDVCKIPGCSDTEGNCNPSHSHTFAEKIRSAFKYAYVEFLWDISKWLLIGIVAAGTIAYLVPPSLIENYLGSGFRPMLVMLLAGIPLYICASASTPIAAALIAKGLSPGAALVFLLVGPATNVATLGVVGKFMGRRSVAIYLGSIAACAVVMGFLLDGLYHGLGLNPSAIVGQARELVPAPVQVFSAVLLLGLTVYSYWHERGERECHVPCADEHDH